MDAVAAKPYGFDSSPGSDRSVRSDTLNFSRVVALREVIRNMATARSALGERLGLEQPAGRLERRLIPLGQRYP